MPVVAQRRVEGLVHPVGDQRAAAFGEGPGRFPVHYRHDARRDRLVDARLFAGIAEAQEGFGLEEELGDRLVRAGVELALEPFDIGRFVGGVGVRIGVGAHADGELVHIGERLDQLTAVGEALRMRGKTVGPVRRVAAQGHDVGHACFGKAARHVERFFAAGTHAGQMGGHRQAGGAPQHMRRILRQVPGGAPGTIGDGEKPRGQRRERLRGIPQLESCIDRTGRENFEGYAGRGHYYIPETGPTGGGITVAPLVACVAM